MTNIKWVLDPDHSELSFKIKHLMITTVTGYFKKFTLEVETKDDDFITASHIFFCAEIDSISTNNEQRDHHLRSVDFFDSKTYPELLFTGKKIRKEGEKLFLQGDLTIRGTTNYVEVELDFGGITVDSYGQTKAGFSIDGIIKRKSFGLVWDAITETGNVVLSDEVIIHGEIQLIKQLDRK